MPADRRPARDHPRRGRSDRRGAVRGGPQDHGSAAQLARSVRQHRPDEQAPRRPRRGRRRDRAQRRRRRAGPGRGRKPDRVAVDQCRGHRRERRRRNDFLPRLLHPVRSLHRDRRRRPRAQAVPRPKPPRRRTSRRSARSCRRTFPCSSSAASSPTPWRRGWRRGRAASALARGSTSRASRPPTRWRGRAPMSPLWADERRDPHRRHRHRQDCHRPAFAGDCRQPALHARRDRRPRGTDGGDQFSPAMARCWRRSSAARSSWTRSRSRLRRVRVMPLPATASRRGSTSCSRNRRPRRSPKSTIWRGAPPNAGSASHDVARPASSGRRRRGGPAQGPAHPRDGDDFGMRMSKMASRAGVDLAGGRLWRVRSGHQRFFDRRADLPAAVKRARGGLVVPRRGRHANRGRDRLRQRGKRGAASLQPRLAADRRRGMDHPRHDRGGTTLELRDGGAQLLVDGQKRESGAEGEYPSIYRRFAELVDARQSEVDSVPLRMVADCLLMGSRHSRRLKPLSGSRADENPARGWLHPCRGRRGRTPAWSRALSRADERLRPVKRASPAAVQT